MANPKSQEAQQSYTDKNPFEGMKISDNSCLSKLDGRHPCDKCGKSRKFYCYSCYLPIAPLIDVFPNVKLPLKIDIIKHKHEIDGKSTAGHAAILAPDDVAIYTYPDIPSYTNENVVLIFPSQNAISVQQLVNTDYSTIVKTYCFNNNQQLDESSTKGFHKSTLMQTAIRNAQFDHVKPTTTKSPNRTSNVMNNVNKIIFIDSTWNQSKGIFKDDRIKNIPCVVIQNRISQFWRHQKGSPRWYLATIEAIHQFLIEIHLYSWGLHPDYKGIYNCFTPDSLKQFDLLYKDDETAYNGQYDNLLFIFHHMYGLIHSYYDHDNLYAYKRRLT